MPRYLKDPSARLDYAVDWTAWLQDGDSIATSEWLTGDLTPTEPRLIGATATVWLSGGVLGVTYRITNRITTAAGRTDERTLRLLITER